MLTDGNHKPGSVKMGYYALRFLFVHIYNKEWAKEYLPTPKVAKTLPLVLSKEEVFDVLHVIQNFKHQTVIMFIYSTGVRISECVNIKLTDIDSRRMQVNIQEGKGLKQRKVPLSPLLLKTLRRYYREYKPGYYLFEGQEGKGTHLGVSAVREICRKARYLTPAIKKRYTPHTFRHCFATHHLEQGTNMLVIQRLMGHANLTNTLKYLHVQKLENRTDNQPAGQTGRSGGAMQKITVCDILRQYGGKYITENHIKGQQKGIINLLSNCHTSALGSHYRCCNHCGHTDKVYNPVRTGSQPPLSQLPVQRQTSMA